MNNLSKVATQQWNGRQSKPRPLESQANILTIPPPRHNQPTNQRMHHLQLLFSFFLSSSFFSNTMLPFTLNEDVEYIYRRQPAPLEPLFAKRHRQSWRVGYVRAALADWSQENVLFIAIISTESTTHCTTSCTVSRTSSTIVWVNIRKIATSPQNNG